MSSRAQFRERDVYWATLGVLLLLVVLADVLLISRHNNELRRTQHENAEAEIGFLAGLIQEALSNEQYHLAELLVQEWGEKNTDTVYLAVETPEGFQLARYAVDKPIADFVMLERRVEYRPTRHVRVKLETDMQAALLASREFAVQVLAGSLVLLVVFGQMLMLLDRNRRQRVLDVWAHQDALTGVANRRRFERALDVEWRRARRLQTSLALIMADIDAFKAYNDRLGHPAGDDCLRKIAAALTEQVSRPADLVARYGGEEFAVILPDTDLANARHLAEQMRIGVEALQLTHPNAAHSVVVTMSFGVAALVPTGEQASTELIARADRALYTAKAAGGNSSAATPGMVPLGSAVQHS